MAEIVGVVGSAIGIATLLQQIIQSIDELRALKAFVKRAPSDLQELIKEIEIVQSVLKTLTPEMLECLELPTERRLHSFRDNLDALISEIQKYRISVTNRRLGAVRLAMKRETIRMHRQNLENIKGMILLLQQVYCSASIRELSSRIQPQDAWVDTKSKVLDKDNQEECKAYKESHRKSPVVKNTGQQEYRFRTWLLFIDKLWTVRMNRLSTSWTFTIQVNNVIPHNSPIFSYCVEGNVKEVQRLFADRLASPFDCDGDGTSLLHVAAVNGQLELCEMLLENGADSHHKNIWGHNALIYANFAARDWVIKPDIVPLLVDLYRLFIKHWEDGDDPFECLHRWGPSPLSSFYGPPEALALIQQYSFTRYVDLPLNIRFRHTMSLNTWWVSGTSPDVIRNAMGGGRIELAAYQMEDENGESLFSKIIEYVAIDLSNGRMANLLEWRPLMLDAIAAPVNLHQVPFKYDWRRTPLIRFLQVFTHNWKEIRRARYCFNFIFQTWVSELKIAGVDLEVYGAKERALLKNGDIPIEFYVYVGLEKTGPSYRPGTGEFLSFRLLDFAYGSNPEDWQAWVTNPVDELVGEFWEMIARKEEVMPGTWID